MGGSRRQLNIAGLLAGVALLATTFVSSPASYASSAKSPYVIGFTGPLTGPVAQYGIEIVHDDQGYFHYVNAHGGVNGHPLKLVSLDSGANPSTDATNALQLITADHAIAITGLVIDSNCPVVAKITDAHQVPLLCSTGSESLTADPFVFSLTPLLQSQVRPDIQLAKRLVHGKIRIATVADQTTAAAQWGSESVASAKAAGMATTGLTTVSPADIDLSTVAANLEASNPNVVNFDITSEQQTSLVRSMDQDGYKGIFIGSGSTFDYPTLSTLANPSVYVTSSTEYVSPPGSGSAAKGYVQSLASQGVTSVAKLNVQEQEAWYAGSVGMVAGLKACGANCTGGQALVKGLESVSLDLTGVQAQYQWTKKVHSPKVTYYAYHWVPSKGAPVLVASGLTQGT